MPKTKKDLLLETTRLMLDSVGSNAMEDFERDLLPFLIRDCPTLGEEMSDEEYRQEIANFRDNLPAMVGYLRQHKVTPLPFIKRGVNRN